VGQAQVPIWNVPYQRNLLFTGREEVLKRLYEALRAGKTAALAQPQAISGLGGIGKTQTAIEYAYRYQDNYRIILWVKADTSETLISDFVAIAYLLNLTEKNAQDQHLIVNAVKNWLDASADWLLILDNADDFTIIQGFLPSPEKGHILLTTRARAMGKLAQRVELDKMEMEEGVLFLLRRANIIAPDVTLEAVSSADRAQAQRLWAERTVQAINQGFSDMSVKSWPVCQFYLPHALVCAALIDQWDIILPEATHLLHQAGSYARTRTQYQEAEMLLKQAVKIREQVLGPRHLDTAKSREVLASLYLSQSRDEQARSLIEQAIEVFEQSPGSEHPALI
jgi:hypothetical protein